MNERRFSHALMHVGGGQVVAGLLKLATPLIAARLMAPRAFGVYSVVVVLVLLIFNVGNFGISPSTTYHIARARWHTSTASYNSMLLAWVLGIIGSVIGGAVVLPLRHDIARGADVATIVLALASIPAYYAVNAALGVFLGREDHRRYNGLSIGFYAAVIVATVGALAVDTSATAAVAGWLLGSLLAATAGVFMVRHEWNGRRPGIERLYWRDTLAYGAKSHASMVVTFLSYRLDVVLVAALLGPARAGLYAAAVAIAEVLWLFSQVAGWVLFARVAADDDDARRRRLTAVTARFVLSVSGGAAVFLAIVARPLMHLAYGPEYTAAAGALRILLIGIVTLSVSRVIANYIAAIGFPARNIPGSVLALVTNVALNIILIPAMGIKGAALASAVSYSLTLVDRVIAFARLGGSDASVTECLVPRAEDLVQLRDSVTALRARRPRSVDLGRRNGRTLDLEHALERNAR